MFTKILIDLNIAVITVTIRYFDMIITMYIIFNKINFEFLHL